MIVIFEDESILINVELAIRKINRSPEERTQCAQPAHVQNQKLAKVLKALQATGRNQENVTADLHYEK